MGIELLNTPVVLASVWGDTWRLLATAGVDLVLLWFWYMVASRLGTF